MPQTYEVVKRTPLPSPRWRTHWTPAVVHLQIAHHEETQRPAHAGHIPHSGPIDKCHYCSYTFQTYDFRDATADEIDAWDFTTTNSTSTVRSHAAEWYATHGYVGPLKSGEARSLRGLMTAVGKPECVKRGWVVAPRTTKIKRSRLAAKKSNRLKGPVWLFQSPIAGVDMKDFLALAKMYQGDVKDERLKVAILELLTRPVDEVRQEVKTFSVLEKLARLAG